MREKLYTEASSKHRNLDKMSTSELLKNMNDEDKSVALAVEMSLGQLELLIDALIPKILKGGRLFYIGAGSSGRLGILDASECPPTYGVDETLLTGIIAGGDAAIRKAVENAEDDDQQGFADLLNYNISDLDFVIGIAASGKTPYVLGALKACKLNKIATGCVVCNHHTPIAEAADYPVEIIVGPEFVSGSTRMKAGTAQKMALNMISTALMIKLGRVKDNKMIDMKISNAKLKRRGIQMICQETGINTEDATKLLERFGSVRMALDAFSDSDGKK